MTGWTSKKVVSLTKGQMSFSYILAFLAAFVIAAILAFVLLAINAGEIGDGVVVAVVLWVGFTGATIGVNMTFERRPL